MSVATVTATVEASNVPPRVRLDISDTGAPAFGSVTVTRLNPDGSTVPVRTSDGNPLPMSANAGLVYDYEMPYGQAVTYSTQETPANVTTPVTVPASQVWLVDPSVPSLSQPLRLGRGSFTTRSRPTTRGVYEVMGRSTPVVVTDGVRKSVESTLVVVLSTLADLDELEALTAGSGVLLLNIPATLGYNFSTNYISPGDITETIASEMAFESWSSVSVPFRVVDRPAGGAQSQRTLADLLAYPTLASLQSAYPTLATVLAGP